MPTYGRSFTLASRGNSKVNAPSSGGGVAGKYTKEGGFLAYYEVSNSLKQTSIKKNDRWAPLSCLIVEYF